jgi:hypothetical protein
MQLSLDQVWMYLKYGEEERQRDAETLVGVYAMAKAGKSKELKHPPAIVRAEGDGYQAPDRKALKEFMRGQKEARR